jgi:tetratricopeptide (TPR) repeat protein
MLREILDQTAARIGTELANQPEVQAELRSVLSETYIALEDYSAGLAQSTEALRLLRLHHHGDEAVAAALYYQARPLIALGRNKEAVDAFAEALAIRQGLYGEDHLSTATIRGEMAWPLMNLGRTAEAEQCARMATAYWRKLPNQALLLGGPRSLAMILHRTHRNEEAVAVTREELAGIEKTLGKEHPILVNTLDNLGYLLLDVGGWDEAEPISREALRQSRKFVPGHEGDRDHIYQSLLRIAAHRQDWDGQLALAREFVARCRSEIPFDPADVKVGGRALARVMLGQAEHFAELDPARTLKLLEEVEGSPDFAPEVKAAGGWVDCLRGLALGRDAAEKGEAKALMVRGLEAMQKKEKEKPTAQDAQRIKKVEAKIAELGVG